MKLNQIKTYLFGAGKQDTAPKDRYWLHITLFVLSFISCMLAGTAWIGEADLYNITTWHRGLLYAILILTFLSAHEFGHYFAAKYHKVDATLPFYIPMPIIPGLVPLSFGTMGAVIKMRSRIPSRKALFDIGVAGPIAGFVVCIVYLIYGFATLPGIEYLYDIHPNYVTELGGAIPDGGIHFGNTIIYWMMSNLFANPDGFIPPMNEFYHYPFLSVGWFGLFVTSLNMLPIGQLDGGHITYAMFGKTHKKIALYAWRFIFILGISSFINLTYETFRFEMSWEFLQRIREIILPPLEYLKTNFPMVFYGWFGWLVWSFVTKVIIKLEHPPIEANDELGKGRMLIGWFTIAILIGSFSINGIYLK